MNLLSVTTTRCHLILAFVLLNISLHWGQNTHVYVSAHPDDWQLFMNPNAYHDLQNAEDKVIFLHTTAGDAGEGIGNMSYYLAREEGSLRAIRFMCNTINNALKEGDVMNETSVMINGHIIKRFSYANAVAYFLRLPDGNYAGPGYAVHNMTSLEKFYRGDVTNLRAIDGSTTYTSLNDLIRTTTSLINYETVANNTISFNIAETDVTTNPGDHSDHIHSSLIMQKVAKDLGMDSVRLYEEYATNEKAINIFDDDFLICAGTWGATASGLSDSYHDSTWNAVHNVWIGRQYFRTVLLSDLLKE